LKEGGGEGGGSGNLIHVAAKEEMSQTHEMKISPHTHYIKKTYFILCVLLLTQA